MSDVQSNTTSESAVFEDTSDIAEAILSRWEDGENLSEPTSEATDVEEEEETTETSETTEEQVDEEDQVDEDPVETEETEEEEVEEAETETSIEVTDETNIEIVVNGETKQASIKDLKRLYGQEASLTRKSQEVATQRKAADEAVVRADASLKKMIERAEAKYKPYADIDMLVASRQMEPDDFAQLRLEAKEAQDEVKFFSEEANNFYGQMKQAQDAEIEIQATECIKVLKADIPDWSDELYNQIRNYAVTSGLPQEQVNRYTDASVIKLINKARLYDQSKKVAVAKKAKAPVKVLRSQKAPPTAQKSAKSRLEASNARLKANPNDFDEIAEAIMARWED